jgi:hypothetical protein
MWAAPARRGTTTTERAGCARGRPEPTGTAFALPERERTDANIRLRECRDRTRRQVLFEDAKIGDDDDVISSGSRELS